MQRSSVEPIMEGKLDHYDIVKAGAYLLSKNKAEATKSQDQGLQIDKWLSAKQEALKDLELSTKSLRRSKPSDWQLPSLYGWNWKRLHIPAVQDNSPTGRMCMQDKEIPTYETSVKST